MTGFGDSDGIQWGTLHRTIPCSTIPFLLHLKQHPSLVLVTLVSTNTPTLLHCSPLGLKASSPPNGFTACRHAEPSFQTCKKTRPPVEGNFQDVGKFGVKLDIPIGEICYFPISSSTDWENSSFSHWGNS